MCSSVAANFNRGLAIHAINAKRFCTLGVGGFDGLHRDADACLATPNAHGLEDDEFRQWYHFDAEKKTLGHLAKAGKVANSSFTVVLACPSCLGCPSFSLLALLSWRRPLRWYFRAKKVLTMIQSGTV